eukprot:10478178-Karenia_brevis.AAC.1
MAAIGLSSQGQHVAIECYAKGFVCLRSSALCQGFTQQAMLCCDSCTMGQGAGQSMQGDCVHIAGARPSHESFPIRGLP